MFSYSLLNCASLYTAYHFQEALSIGKNETLWSPIIDKTKDHACVYELVVFLDSLQQIRTIGTGHP